MMGAYQVLIGIRCREVESDHGCLFSNACTDFQDAQLYGIEVGYDPGGAFHSRCLEGVQEHVGGAVQEDPELVG